MQKTAAATQDTVAAKIAKAQAARLKAEAAQLQAQMISTFTALKNVAGQEKNAESLLEAVKAGHIPNAHKSVLYAIGGKAGLATVPDYAKNLKSKLKQDPKVKHYCYCWSAQKMAGTNPTPPPRAAPSNQAQLAQYAYFPKSQRSSYGHDIMVEFRCPSDVGGNDNVIRRAATLNDTGSNTQSIHRSDWNALKAPGMTTYEGRVSLAIGGRDVENVFLEIRIVKPPSAQNPQGPYVPLTKWFTEKLILVDDNAELLSGELMRQYLYFATAPGNDRLLVSQRKQAIIDGLDLVQPDLP